MLLLVVFSVDSEEDDYDGGNLDRMGEMISDLIMWRDVAISSLWFGFGSLCFLSSCFAKGVNFRCVFLWPSPSPDFRFGCLVKITKSLWSPCFSMFSAFS